MNFYDAETQKEVPFADEPLGLDDFLELAEAFEKMATHRHSDPRKFSEAARYFRRVADALGVHYPPYERVAMKIGRCSFDYAIREINDAARREIAA